MSNVLFGVEKMKVIRIDTSAHAILLEAKEELKKRGVEHPTHSDAIRGLKNKKIR